MVGRPRRTSTHSEQITTEIAHIQAKNLELVKALAEMKDLYNQSVKERNYFQKELFLASLRIKKLQNYINNIDTAARETINAVLALSNHTSDILRYTSSSKRTQDTSDNLNSSNCENKSYTKQNKMQVVKPMISGHVILRPTINLRRVNEISLEEIQSLRSENNSQQINVENVGQNNSSDNVSFRRLSNVNRTRGHSDRQYTEEDEDEENNHELDQSVHSSDDPMETDNHLTSIEEERDSDVEENTPSRTRRSSLSSNRNDSASLTLPSTSTQIPLLSGVFKEVRVYLSPVDPHSNVTKVRGSSKRHLNRSLEMQPSKLNDSLSTNSLADNLNTTEQETENYRHTNNAFRAYGRNSTLCQSTNVSHENIFDSDSPCSNKQNDAINKSRRHTEYLHTPKKLTFTSKSSTNGTTMLNSDYDPLEGPSNLLDSYESNKFETLCGLGLTPVSKISLSPKPSSPALTVLNRRKNKVKMSFDENSTPTHPTFYITNKKSEKKGKVSKTPKVSISRLSVKSPENSNSALVKRRRRKTRKTNLTNSPESPSSISFTPMTNVSPKNSNSVSVKNRQSKTRKINLTNSMQPSSSKSLSSTTESPKIKKSPIKRERTKRMASHFSMKEPSLRKKLRRSK